MKIKILNQDHVSTRNNNTIATINDLDNISIKLPYRKLVIEHKGVEVAKYDAVQRIDFEEFEDRLICFLHEGKIKRISFEIFGDYAQLIDVKKLILKRNRAIMYKSPLQKEYSTKIQESMMVDKNRELNIKGFINLAIIFVCLNYIRLIIESKTDDRFVFVENVNLLVAYTQP